MSRDLIELERIEAGLKTYIAIDKITTMSRLPSGGYEVNLVNGGRVRMDEESFKKVLFFFNKLDYDSKQ